MTTASNKGAEPNRRGARTGLRDGMRRIVARLARATAEAMGDDQTRHVNEVENEIAIIKTAVDHIGRGIQMIDRDGRVLVANRTAAEMLGVDPTFLQTKPLLEDVIHAQWERRLFECTDPKELAEHIAVRDKLLLSQGWRLAGRYERTQPDGTILEVESISLPNGSVVRTHTDITERHLAEKRIRQMAHNDFLTGLANRARFQEALDAAGKSTAGFAVILIDLDHFKTINDTHGHQVGDALLKEVARRIQRVVRGSDLVCRLGGDEFAVILNDIPAPAVAERVAADIVASMATPFEQGDAHVHPSASIGVAAVAPGEENREEREHCVRRADIALYSAKAAGKGRWHAFDPAMHERDVEEKRLVEELRQAIEHSQFEVFYQPIVHTKTEDVTGFEALLRWHHPTRGLLAAGQFLPTIENTGMIVEVGNWVLQTACRDAMEWPEGIRLLVNMSPRQLSRPDMMGNVETALRDSGLPPKRLELEITESSVMQAGVTSTATITQLRDLGIRIALDDFGTGYSSLSHISTLHFDTIKIDRSFVAEAATRSDCAAVVRAVTLIAGDLAIDTVAEGVETQEQLDWIRNVGCTEAQGYLFSKPVPLSTANEIARKHRQPRERDNVTSLADRRRASPAA